MIEAVAVTAAEDHPAGGVRRQPWLQHPAELADQPLHLVHRGGGRVGRPQRVDQLGHPDHRTAGRHQDRRHDPLTRRSGVDLLPIPPDPQAAEDVHPDGGGHRTTGVSRRSALIGRASRASAANRAATAQMDQTVR